ncbi:hypothetical protein N3K66_002760 [Trichothecium roseum]|uniref:Uncharacterized protein n=1 Tax=Trichothecium roseum TaxID=47278 RepID=A0ACC0VCB6_9HYPO|nr:hypothetical protein N3K66_002760 [Trichothecium roseum]
MTDKKKKAGEPLDLITRGVKGPSPAGTLSFISLRAADPFLQYQILASGWGAAALSRAGISTISSSAASSALLPSAATAVTNTGIALVDRLRLPLPHLLLLGMSVGAAAKQIYWVAAVSHEAFPASAALTVAGFNTAVNTLAALLLLAAPTSAALSAPFPGTSLPYPCVVGPALYAVGLALGAASEVQRRDFKESPAGRGKVMRAGLWSRARHVNYGGYALWRAGYALAGGGVVAGLAAGLFQAWDFAVRAVPVLDEYCGKRYGEDWASFKRDVRWILLPGIY